MGPAVVVRYTQSQIQHESGDLRRCAMKYMKQATSLREQLSHAEAKLASELVSRDLHLQKQVRVSTVCVWVQHT